MREIKFRAWDTKRKKMYSADEMGEDQLTLMPDGRGFINVNGTSTKLSQFCTHLIPMQYTGLKDKNGTEIYEEDIIEYPNFMSGKIQRIEVKFILGSFGFGAANIYEKLKSINGEVIGNIHQNPELLK